MSRNSIYLILNINTEMVTQCNRLSNQTREPVTVCHQLKPEYSESVTKCNQLSKVAKNARLELEKKAEVIISKKVLLISRCQMGRVPVTIMGYRCDRCGHEWIILEKDLEPRECPQCKSQYWDLPPLNKPAPMSFEEFCNNVKSILVTPDIQLTWTEIRTKAKLPQKFPNNQWVHRMEKEIGLRRERDNNGIIRWRIDLE